jgi:hypothetical protein
LWGAPDAIALLEMDRIPDWAEFAEEVEQLFGADGVAEVLDKERSVELLVVGFGRDRVVETNLFTSGASLEFLLIAWLVVVQVVDVCGGSVC